MESPYGKITSAWKIEKEQFELQVTIPHNTEAKIYIPAKQASGVMENAAELSKRKEIRVEGFEAGYLVVSVGSGSYRFTSSWTP
jgi:alpha-L-rhamnosidase